MKRKRDADKTKDTLIVELNVLRDNNARLNNVISRYQKVASGKDLYSSLYDLEHKKKDIESLRAELLEKRNQLDSKGEELLVQNEKLRSQIEALNARDKEKAIIFLALQDSEEQLRLAQLAANVGVWDWYPKTGKNYFSPEMNQLYGLSPNTIKSYQDWLNRVHPDDIDRIVAERDKAMAARKPYDLTYRVLHGSGEIRWMNEKGHAIFDKNGGIVRVLGINSDITERKLTEIELEKARQQAELYVDLMGHDINNINQAAMGFLELALMTLETEKKLKLDDKLLIERPLIALQGCSKLIANVRKLQQFMKEGVQTKPADIGDILKEIDVESFDFDGREITINIPVVQRCVVETNELLRDVFLNLINNAIKHSDEEKPLTINVKVDPIQEKGVKYYRCIVEDNGPGIPEEVKVKLFNRFQRGETTTQGKGLGLYLVRTLVQGYHGRVWVEDRVPGDHKKGSRFVVVLPAA